MMLAPTPTEQERSMAAAAHGSILLSLTGIPLAGVGAAALIWFSQRDRSRWVAWQARQSVAYQVTGLVIGVLAGLIAFASMFGALRADMAEMTGAFDSAGSALGTPLDPSFAQLVAASSSRIGDMLGFFGLLLVFNLIWIAGGLFVALKVYRGSDFCYPLLGRIVEPPPAALPGE